MSYVGTLRRRSGQYCTSAEVVRVDSCKVGGAGKGGHSVGREEVLLANGLGTSELPKV